MTIDTPLTLRKFLAPEIVFGDGAVNLAGRHAMNLGASKVLVVTDSGVRRAGWAEIVENSLRQSQIDYEIFDGVTPNPKDYEVMTGAEIYEKESCDFIIAVGGGSPMDCAKGIGIVVGNGGHITRFEGIDEVPNPGPPLVFIPTTAGSSADVSQFAIVKDTKRNIKIAIVSKMAIPDIALVDPKTTLTMSPELTAATGMDAFCHAVESYVSTASSPLTDMAALSAIELINGNLLSAYQQPEDGTYRSNMMMASLMAGLAFSNASLGMVHAMAHALGGLFDLAHGECNAILLEEVVRYNYPAVAQKYDRIAQAMVMDTKSPAHFHQDGVLVGYIASLRKSLGIDERLKDLGVDVPDISRLAEHAVKDTCLATNPKPATSKDIEQIYKRLH